MGKGKSSQLWLVNVVSFILFSILTLTGMINWIILPRGPRSDGGILITLRHFLRDVHEWAALGFIILIALHLWLHWNYIRSNLNK